MKRIELPIYLFMGVLFLLTISCPLSLIASIIFLSESSILFFPSFLVFLVGAWAFLSLMFFLTRLSIYLKDEE